MRRLLLLLALVAVGASTATGTITLQSAGTIVGDADPHADPTVTLPAHATGDLMFLMAFVRDADDTASITVATGWAAVTGFPVDRGTSSRYWLWYKVATSSSETNPVIDFSGTTGDMYYVVTTYRGTAASSPIEVTGTAATGTTDPATHATLSSLTANSMIVLALMGEDNNNAACTTTGTDPAAYTEHYSETVTGLDAMTCFSEELRTSAGATGTVSLDFDVAVPVGWGLVLMAIKPPSNQVGDAAVSMGISPAVSTPVGRQAPAAATLALSCPVCVDVKYPLDVTLGVSPAVGTLRNVPAAPAVSLGIAPAVETLRTMNAAAAVALNISPAATGVSSGGNQVGDAPVSLGLSPAVAALRNVPVGIALGLSISLGVTAQTALNASPAVALGVSPAVQGIAGRTGPAPVSLGVSPAVGALAALNAAAPVSLGFAPAVSAKLDAVRPAAVSLAMNVGATAVAATPGKRSVTVIMVPV